MEEVGCPRPSRKRKIRIVKKALFSHFWTPFPPFHTSCGFFLQHRALPTPGLGIHLPGEVERCLASVSNMVFGHSPSPSV